MNKIIIIITTLIPLFCLSQNKYLNKIFIAMVGQGCKLRTDGGCSINNYIELQFLDRKKVNIKSYSTFICTPKEIEDIYKDIKSESFYESYNLYNNTITINNFNYSPLKFSHDKKKLYFVKDKDTINFVNK